MLFEYVGNLHMHTTYSDGHGSHDEIALAAIRAGLDFVVVTDHNVWVDGMDGYRFYDDERVLLLTGEEIHDQLRDPQQNHLLVFEALQELAPLAPEPQRLIDAVNKAGGFSFLAHPLDPAAPLINEPDLSWVDWDITGFTGMEIWNFMTEFKSLLKSFPAAFFYAYNPTRVASGPFPEVLERWDQLTTGGKRVVAIGGSDAHAFPIRKGIFKRIIFPYEWLFKAVNTHVLTHEPLTGNMENDRRNLFRSIAEGHCFVGNDQPAPTHGFRFTAQGDGKQAIMGGTLEARYGITLQAKIPQPADIRLIRNGEEIRRWVHSESALITTTKKGVYRVEAHLSYQGKLRGWIYSNPIYITD